MQKLFKEVIPDRSVWRGPFSLVTFLFGTSERETFIRLFKVTPPPLGGLGWVFPPLGGLGWVFHPFFIGRAGVGLSSVIYWEGREGFSIMYNITTLGRQYFPNSTERNARRRFIALLQSEKDLWNSLCSLHFKPYQRCFTPKQYELVIDVLGRPESLDSDFAGWM